MIKNSENMNEVFGGDLTVDLSELTESQQQVNNLVETFIEKKRNFVGEIIVTLFEDCNLSCKFCNQDHNSVEGLDRIGSKIESIRKSIDTLVRMRKTAISVHFMGGEIFQDKFDDSLFQDYLKLSEATRDYAAEVGLPLDIVFVSNLIHFNTARVKQLIHDVRALGVNASLGTSYDPSMRFSAANLVVFEKNLEIYKDYIRVVNVILTRPNIEKFLNRKTPSFDYIYENFEVFFDYYTPEENWEVMNPSDREMRDMFVWLLANYPNTYPVADWKSHDRPSMTCQSTITVMPDGKAGRCTVLLNSFKKKDDAPDLASEMEHNFITKNECMSCEFFTSCGLGCFLQHHFQTPNRSMNECWMKDVHRAIRG